MKIKYFNLLFILLLLTVYTDATAQVCGISGTKLCVPHGNTLSKGSFEFEPSFSVFSAKQFFNRDGSSDELVSRNVQSDLVFRITLGLLDNLEFGTSFSPGMEDISVGSKLALIQNDNLAFAFLIGGSLPAGNYSGSDESVKNDLYTYSTGVSLTNDFTEIFSLDTYVSYTKINGTSEFNHLISYGTGAGYYITEVLQAVFEINGFHTFNGSFHSRKLSLTPGFTFDFSSNLGFAFGFQKDITGVNELNGLSYFSAFTMSF